jgi:hypothetical protein
VHDQLPLAHRSLREPTECNRSAYPTDRSDECQERKERDLANGAGIAWFIYRNQQRYIEDRRDDCAFQSVASEPSAPEEAAGVPYDPGTNAVASISISKSGSARADTPRSTLAGGFCVEMYSSRMLARIGLCSALRSTT